eukprot:GHVS01096109.1.p1 GENE.GHVS01096109.1~~GHVS01096109.1.p1  ORF type:complete len:295 (-),score=39.99 GHVS01096109.1:170-1054(-)
MTLPDLSPPADMKTSLSRDGFAVCRNFFSKQIMLELRQRCLDLVDDFTPPTSTSQQHSSTFSTSPEDRTGGEFLMASADEIRFFVEKDNSKVFVDNLYSINKIGHALHEKDPVFRRFSTRPEILQLFESLDYKDPSIVQSMYILKQPKTGGPVHPHQDGCFLYTEPQTVIGAWFAIDDANITNGCLYVVPGSHRNSVVGRYSRLSETRCGFQIEPTYSIEGAVPLEATSGDLVLLDSNVVHFSDANTSTLPRHAYTLHIAELNTHWPQENWIRRLPDNPFRSLRAESAKTATND